MDTRTRDQDLFPGDTDEIIEIADQRSIYNITSATASTGTLVAPELIQATANPLSIHRPSTTWCLRQTPSQETLVPGGPRGTTYNDPPPSYLEPFPAFTQGQVLDGQVAPVAPTVEERAFHVSDRRTVHTAQPVEGEATRDEFQAKLPWAGDNYMTDDEIFRFTQSTGHTSPLRFHGGTLDAPEPNVPAYTLAADKALLQTAMGFVDFLGIPQRPGMLVVVTADDDDSFVVSDLDLDLLENQCPLLAMGFERNRAGVYKNSLEAGSRILAISFLRFLCTGSYLVEAGDNAPLIHPSLLFHTRIYQMADNYDLPALKREAQANITRVTEFACCYPDPPGDLCEATRFIYAELNGHKSLIASIQHFCVNCFRSHNLKDSLTFRQLVDEVPMFGLDLLSTNIERGFSDEGAADIIQLPINTAPRTAQLEAEQLALVDFVYDVWGPRTFETRCGYDSTTSSTPSSPRLQGYALVRRPKCRPTGLDSEQSDESASEGEGFTLVHRSRPSQAGDVTDLSDWSEVDSSGHEGMNSRQRDKFPLLTRLQEPHLSSSVATLRPHVRSPTPRQADPASESDDSLNSSDIKANLAKPQEQSKDSFDDSDGFEIL